MMVANQSCIHEQCKSRLRKIAQYFVQFSYEYFVFASSVRKKLRIKRKKTVTLSVGFCGCEGKVVVGSRVVRVIFELKRGGGK